MEAGHNQRNVEFAYRHPNGEWAVLFEAKGHEQLDLFETQKHRREKPSQETPIKQTRDNMERFVETTHTIKYGVCTNYVNFVLMMYYPKHRLFQEFDFSKTKDNDQKLKEFIGIFSYKTLVLEKDTSIQDYKKKSEGEDKDVTDKFYQLFHETRLMIIKEFQASGHTQREAIFYTQLFLNRILFLFFAVDTGLIDDKKLFTDRVIRQLDLDQCTEDSTQIFDDIESLFRALNNGSKVLGFSAFNGELFSGSPLPVHFLDYRNKGFFAEELSLSRLIRPPKLVGQAKEIFKKHETKVNPIIRNLLIMDSYDFSSKESNQSSDSSGNVNVTILGHILEQSIGHIDQLLKVESLTRKVKGIFYTPETLTDYLCRNTIIPYLSKSNVNDVDELILEYENDIPELEEKLDSIKIIDPACGSGAFLIKAAEILLEITAEIEKSKDPDSPPDTMDSYLTTETPKIITNNIFGTDITRASVEITKLSLFLKTATRDQKLPDLSKNIVTGNSLIDDPNAFAGAINWHEQFPDIMNSGGFDVVIGNPPWQIIKADQDEFFTPLKEMQLLLENEFPNKNQKFSLLKAGTKKRLVDKCLEDDEIKERYNEYLEDYKRQADFFNTSSAYKLQGKSGDAQLYKLFVERSLKITKPNAMFGMVMPAGILQDLGTKEIRQEILTNHAIKEFCAFVNGKPIFDGVHRQFSFSTLILKKGVVSPIYLTRKDEYDDDILQDFQNYAFEYSLDFVQTTSPFSLAVLECGSKEEKEILEKIYEAPKLMDWGKFNPIREFDMTNDKDLFKTTETGPPLYEGKMIHMFTHNFAPPKQWLVLQDAEAREVEKEKRRIPKKIRDKNPKMIFRIGANEYKLVWRSITNATDQRTLISTVLPPNFTGNNLNCLIPITFDENTETYVKPVANDEMIFLCGMFNSFVVDYVMRHKLGGSNVNYFHMNELPIPRYDQNNSLHEMVFRNSAMLICTTDEFADLRDKIGVDEFENDNDRRFSLITRINAAAAKIFGLTTEQLEQILQSFPQSKNQHKRSPDWVNSSDLQKAILDEFSSI